MEWQNVLLRPSADRRENCEGRHSVKVAKFGGTSLANAVQIEKVCGIVLADPERRLVVVSAPGKRHSDDVKVTDLLIQCAKEHLAHAQAATAFDQIMERFAEIARDLSLGGEVLDKIRSNLLRRLANDREHEPRYVDTVKAAGEEYSAWIVAAALSAKGHETHYVCPQEAGLVLSDEFGNAQVLPESYKNLRALKDAPGISVFPGFFGYTKSGDIATFPRGGSDITGAILAAAVHADVYENFTDVNSVFAADPRAVEHPYPIEVLTYREMRELSYAGFAVFHEEAIQPAIQASIPICVKNTNDPQAPGTLILPHRDHTPGEVSGIAGSDGFCSLFIEKYLMNRMVGFGRRILRILEDESIAFQHMPSGIDNLSVIMREARFSPEVEKRVLARIQKELEPDEVSVERGLALIMLVGEGLCRTIGMAARAASALANAGVNIEMINQGSTEISMMFGVKSHDRPKAIRALYGEFFGHKERAYV
jgi:aspartate kinase